MTSLDASALVTDADGMDFLASVLEGSACFVAPKGAFEVAGARHGWTITAGDVDVSRPSFSARVAEAA